MLINLRYVKINEKWVRYMNFNEEYGTMDSTLTILISICGSIILIVVTTFFRLCIYDSRISKINSYAQLTGFWDFYFHLGRSILLIVFIAIPKVFFIDRIKKIENAGIIYYGLFIFIAVKLILLSFSCSYLYDDTARKSRQLCCIFLLCMGIQATGLYIAPEQFEYMEITWIFLMILVMIDYLLISDNNLFKNIELEYKEKNSNTIISYYLELINIIEWCKADNLLATRMLSLYVSYHRSKCGKLRCPLSNTSLIKYKTLSINDDDLNNKEKLLNKLKQTIAFHLRESTLKFPTFIELKMLYIAFVQKYLKSYLEAWTIIDEILINDCPFIQKLHLYSIKYF